MTDSEILVAEIIKLLPHASFKELEFIFYFLLR